MKNDYIKHIILNYIYDSVFDRSFCDKWITIEEYDEVILSSASKAFARFDLNPVDRYADLSRQLFDEIAEMGAIETKGDEFIGVWKKISQPEKDQATRGLQAQLSVQDSIEALGARSLERAASRIAQEDGFAPETGVTDVEVEDFSSIESGPDLEFFERESNKQKFITQADISLGDAEESELSNSDKAQVRGYLMAVKALVDTPDPPADLIWSILQRANSIAGIASFFVALITLMAMIG